MNFSIKNLAMASLLLVSSAACLAQPMGPTAAQMKEARQAWIAANANGCQSIQRALKTAVSTNSNKLSAYCQCTAETYVNSISDEKLLAMVQHPLADKAEQAAVKAKYDAIERQCHKTVGM